MPDLLLPFVLQCDKTKPSFHTSIFFTASIIRCAHDCQLVKFSQWHTRRSVDFIRRSAEDFTTSCGSLEPSWFAHKPSFPRAPEQNTLKSRRVSNPYNSPFSGCSVPWVHPNTSGEEPVQQMQHVPKERDAEVKPTCQHFSSGTLWHFSTGSSQHFSEGSCQHLVSGTLVQTS